MSLSRGHRLAPADVLIQGLGARTAVDFSVVHALQPSIAFALDVQPGKAAGLLNMHERAAICRRVSWSFVPFVAEAVGTLGGKVKHLLQNIIGLYAAHHRRSMAAAANHCRSRLFLAVLRGMARQFERGFPSADGDGEGNHDELCFF